MTMQEVAILIGVGLFGGAWNSVAGGATLFTFPALMATGLPPVVANATNVLALMPANAFALLPFRAELRAVGTRAMPLLAVSGAGAVTGALLSLFPDPAVFEALIPWLVLLATLLFASADRLRLWLLAQSQDWTGLERMQLILPCLSVRSTVAILAQGWDFFCWLWRRSSGSETSIPPT